MKHFFFSGLCCLMCFMVNLTSKAQSYSVVNGILVFPSVNDYQTLNNTLDTLSSEGHANFSKNNGFHSAYERWYTCNQLTTDAAITSYVALYPHSIYIDDSLSIELHHFSPTCATIMNSDGLYQIADTLFFESESYYNRMFPIDARHISNLQSATTSDSRYGINSQRQSVDYYEYCEVYHNGCTCYAPNQRIKCEVLYYKVPNYLSRYRINAETKYQWRNNGISLWVCNSNNGGVGFQFDYTYQQYNCDGKTTTSFTSVTGDYIVFQNVQPVRSKVIASETCNFMQGGNGSPIFNVTHIAKRSEWCHTPVVVFQCINAIGD